MGMRRCAAIAVFALAIAVASPAWAQQNKGNGGGNKPPNTSCDANEYTAWVSFRLPTTPPDPLLADWDYPAIYPTVNPGQPLATTYGNGSVRDYLTMGGDDPITVDFSESGDDLYDGPAEIDPRLTIIAYDNLDPLTSPQCGLFGMLVEGGATPAPTYYGRTGFLWTVEGQQWVLRHKPQSDFGNIPTHAKIVRINNNTWIVTSRSEEEGSDPPHFASLQKTGSGRGKNAIPTEFSTPSMPVEIVLTVDCGTGGCPEPGGD